MTRTGSFLLLAIVLIAVLVALAYALLQTIRISADAGVSSQRAWLAQEAALAGAHHAMENIVADFRQPGRPTFLDGSWHRDFYALGRDRNQPGGAGVTGADDDVRDENVLWDPLNFSDNSPNIGSRGNLYGQSGKARYYEVDYYDPADRAGTRFTDLAAPLPPRNGALFLDGKLGLVQPESGEDAAAVRARARYRLRYAVIVNDTGANILINPALDVDYRDAWAPGQPASTYDELPAGDPFKIPHYQSRFGAARVFAPTELGRRIERYSYSLYNLLSSSPSRGSEGAIQRLTHIFRLRGSSANSARAADGWPVSFPTMYRMWQDTGESNRTMFGSPDANSKGLGLYANQDGDVRLEGGRPIRGNTISNTEGGTSHSLVGPQFSYRNVLRSVAGESNDVHISGTGTRTPNSDQQLGLVTPFGRAGERGVKSQPWQWNRSTTDVPWVVNALTVPSGVTCAMIAGYLPPALGNVQLTVENYYCFMGVVAGRDTFSSSTRTLTLTAGEAGSVDARRSNDLFTDFMSPAFTLWPAPWAYPKLPNGTDNTLNPMLWPNYFISDPRPSSEVYPGPYASLAKLSPDATRLAPEDTGKDIDADLNTVYPCNGWDSHSERQLVIDVTASEVRSRGGLVTDGAGNWASRYTTWELSRSEGRPGMQTPMPTATPGTVGTWGYHPKDYIKSSPDPTTYVFQDSYLRDLSKAFSTSLSVLRAHWVQVRNDWTDPVASFPAGKLAQSDVDSIEDLDRLFLRQLGIDKDDPAGATIQPSWKLSPSTVLPRTYTRDGLVLSNHIRSLVAGDLLATTTPVALTSVQRARAMELMLNDWRMSFLGASPDYSADFRPLDFDGDSWAICSGYSSISSFADDVGGMRWPRQPAVAGSGPLADVPFSLTGCFTIGKSRYYRILTRGELWDSLSRHPVSTATLESVVAIDADGDSVPSVTPASATGLSDDLTVIYQRWYWNRYNGLLPSIYP